MKPLNAKTRLELVQSIIHSDNTLDWVDRKLLIETIGVDDAQRFLPQLQRSICVNLEELTLILKANHPELLKEALDNPVEIQQDIPFTPG
jgi:hypothetical protein